MAELSVVISAFNEEMKIRECLESVKWAPEIVLVDNSSTDKTPQIAKEYTTKVFTRPNNLMLNVNKNFGITRATGDWILSLDGDERVTPELRKEIKSVVSRPPAGEAGQSLVVGYWIPRKNIIFGKWIRHSLWWPDYQLRLFKKGKGRFPEKHVHEKVDVEGETRKLKEPMLHYNYTTVSEFIRKMDTIYTENEVKNIIESGRKLSWVDALRMPVQDFVKTYFAQKGYKDGLHGLVLSILQAMYMEVVFAKMWEQQGFKEQETDLRLIKEEGRKMRREMWYWFLTALMEEAKNPLMKLFFRIKRKFS